MDLEHAFTMMKPDPRKKITGIIKSMVKLNGKNVPIAPYHTLLIPRFDNSSGTP